MELTSYMNLGYTYDDLSLNGMDIQQLYEYLETRKARERAFAVFSLKGLFFSADVRIEVRTILKLLKQDQSTITRSLLSHMEKLIVAHVERLS
jgi:hypothetical protein